MGDVAVEYRRINETCSDGNTKPLQKAGFRMLGSKVIGTPEDYDDIIKKVRTHPPLLPKPKKAGDVPLEDMVLAKATEVKSQDQEKPKVSTSSMAPVIVRRMSVLDDIKYGYGNRPYWEMEERRVGPRCPNLIWTISEKRDSSREKKLLSPTGTR